MKFKKFCKKKLKEYPDGIWIHFESGYHDDEHYNNEFYLDEYYMMDFESILDKEVIKWVLDDYYSNELLVWLE